MVGFMVHCYTSIIKISRNTCMNDHTCVSVLNESREGELQTYNRERMYELYVCSQLVKVGVVLCDHQQIMFVDGHVCKFMKKKSCDFFHL